MTAPTKTAKELIAGIKQIRNNIPNMLVHATSIIAKTIRNDIKHQNIKKPQDAMATYQSLFDQVIEGKKTASLSDVIGGSHAWPTENTFRGDKNRESTMTNTSQTSTNLTLTPVTVHRRERFYVLKNTTLLKNDPHTVDYVMCHLHGFTKYTTGSKNPPIYVRGRDVIISGVLLSLEEIIKYLKSEVYRLL